MNKDQNPWADLNLIHLDQAVLCADCDIISEDLHGACARCSSRAVLPLSQVLGGPLTAPAVSAYYSLVEGTPAFERQVQALLAQLESQLT